MKTAVRIVPLLVLSATIFWQSHQPSPYIPDIGFTWQDKFYHCIAYFLYGLCAGVAAPVVSRDISTRNKALVIIAATMLYGATDEIHQSFIPGRSCEFGDWFADVLGGIFASAIVWLFTTSRGNRRFSSEKLIP